MGGKLWVDQNERTQQPPKKMVVDYNDNVANKRGCCNANRRGTKWVLV